MQEVKTLSFTDSGLNDECVIIIRAKTDVIAVCFSLKENGDVELVLRSDDWEKFLVHLQRAIEIGITDAHGSEAEVASVVAEVVTLNFIDYDCNEEASISISVERNLVKVGLALKHDAEVQLTLRSREWEQFLLYLQQAIEIAGTFEG